MWRGSSFGVYPFTGLFPALVQSGQDVAHLLCLQKKAAPVHKAGKPNELQILVFANPATLSALALATLGLHPLWMMIPDRCGLPMLAVFLAPQKTLRFLF